MPDCPNCGVAFATQRSILEGLEPSLVPALHPLVPLPRVPTGLAVPGPGGDDPDDARRRALLT
jgi:hypothetical protein